MSILNIVLRMSTVYLSCFQDLYYFRDQVSYKVNYNSTQSWAPCA